MAISPPIKSPAPITATVVFLFCKGVLPVRSILAFANCLLLHAPRNIPRVCAFRIFPVEVAGKASSRTISDGRL